MTGTLILRERLGAWGWQIDVGRQAEMPSAVIHGKGVYATRSGATAVAKKFAAETGIQITSATETPEVGDVEM